MTDLAQSLSTQPRLRPIAAGDWLAALVLALGAAFAWRQYGSYMDVYEKAILLLTVPALALLGWHWHGLRNLLAATACAALLGIGLYQHDLARAEQVFWLKYFFSSQTAIAWMSALVFFSTGAFWLGLLARAPFAERVGTALSWVAAGAGLTGLLVRWYESYLIGPDVGHIPVSNLYEVFVLFIILTTLLYLYYARHYATNRLGAFVLPVVAAAVGFLLWYSFSRDAHEIQPLIPALQSYWMKIHVPANFVGYGAFALASMVGVAYLCASRGVLASRLPSIELLDDLMYRAIGIGFAFFTVATILGALWAAEAWGTYWQWDPKETWALIVWLNYAAWLHMRLTKGLRGAVLAWWAIIGLLVTSFAFLGVNMFLSGLHSYGSL
ncbi:c-type cytochrome biogenesis protein CcsB [Niveibacterium sp.]|uniref:c-type cytochrome biogenesis protein CcsB n=1 Tax=Niveibacterium sp. TaxID=2017444 RepID=UPI0035B0C21B